ncbi:MAG: hypothetical protein WD738_23455 [Pirellulales bacterium]
MHSNHFDNTILGTIHHGQVIVVDGTHRALRVLIVKFARRLALRLASWRALKRMPAAMTPALATCPSYSARRQQRSQRWMPGVVETRGTVGVC